MHLAHQDSVDRTRYEAATALTDEEIVARVVAGEIELFELLMRRNNPRVYRASRAILRDDTEAEDVMQDTYVRAFGHLHEFEGRSRFSTWLTKIAVHEAFARLRKQRRLEPLDAHTEGSSMSTQPETSPEQQASDAEMRVVLESAIARLPDDFRSVFVLRAVDGLSGAETAECLGIPEDTVKTRLHRARGRLQEMLVQSIEPALASVFPFHLSRCDRVVAAVFARIRSTP